MRPQYWLVTIVACFACATSASSDSHTFTYQGPTILIPQIVEADYIPATVYPAIIPVIGTNGIITDVDVRLSNFVHDWPADLDMLLVSPTGQNVVLISDAGSSVNNGDFDLIFDDEQLEYAPHGPFPLALTLAYKPTNYEELNDPDVFFSPAPPGPWGEILSVFDGSSANGDWSLLIMDDNNDYQGQLDGWSLTITTAVPEPSNLSIAIASAVLLRRFRAF